MKYAFVALIAIYLVIYGCSPDKSEKSKDTHKQTTQTTVKNSHDGKKAVAEKAVQKETKIVAHEIAPKEQPVAKEQQPAKVAGLEQVVLPCGRVVAPVDIPENAPCLNMQTPAIQDSAAVATEQELTAALQKLVKTTNEMVITTRQLVIATQEMMKAGKKSEEQKQPVEKPAAGKEAAPAHQ